MNTEIEKLITLTVATGEISDKKRELIRRKAEALGEDPDEAELILDGEMAQANKPVYETAHETPIAPDQITSEPEKSDDNVTNIPVFQAIWAFLNRYKFLKYALYFFLFNLIFFLLMLIA